MKFKNPEIEEKTGKTKKTQKCHGTRLLSRQKNSVGKDTDSALISKSIQDTSSETPNVSLKLIKEKFYKVPRERVEDYKEALNVLKRMIEEIKDYYINRKPPNTSK